MLDKRRVRNKNIGQEVVNRIRILKKAVLSTSATISTKQLVAMRHNLGLGIHQLYHSGHIVHLASNYMNSLLIISLYPNSTFSPKLDANSSQVNLLMGHSCAQPPDTHAHLHKIIETQATHLVHHNSSRRIHITFQHLQLQLAN